MTLDPAGAPSVRPLRVEDLDDAVELLSRAEASDARHALRRDLTAGTPFAVVAERDGRIVGAAKVSEDPVLPGTFGALLAVDEAARGQGIGTALARGLDTELRRLGRGTATCSVRDDLPRGRAFAERYGFGSVRHSLGFRYELAGHEAELADRAKAALAHAGVQVRLASMAAEEAVIARCSARCGLGLSLPYGDRPAGLRARLGEFPADTVFLLAEPLDALEAASSVTGGVRPVGMTILVPDTRENIWHARFTGTDPARRGRGVATAVRAASLLYACRAGLSAVTTRTDASDAPAIRANQALGMRPGTGCWSLSRELSHPTPRPDSP